jgi:DNA-binding MarR family transcriptional regulator/RNA polymerase subunit RPABC4/transcription elongation factor Spt4
VNTEELAVWGFVELKQSTEDILEEIPPEETKKCPKCFAVMPSTAQLCPKCKGNIENSLYFEGCLVVATPDLEARRYMVQLFEVSQDHKLIPVSSTKIPLKPHEFSNILSKKEFKLWREYFKNKYGEQQWLKKLDMLVGNMQNVFTAEKLSQDARVWGEEFLFTKPLSQEELAIYKKKVEESLLATDLFEQILKIYGVRIVRETNNVALLELAALSSQFPNFEDRIHTIGIGKSSAGKNHIVLHILRLHPNVLRFTRTTLKAFDWMDRDIDRQIMYIEEYEGMESNYSMRVMLSSGGLVLATPQKDDSMGRMRTTIIRTRGSPALFTTHAETVISDEQMLNRTVDWSPDESIQQTENILRAEAREASTIHRVEFTEDEKVLLALHQVLFSEPVEAVIPYAERLVDLVPKENVRIRRDFRKLLALVKASASLHRRQRLVLTPPSRQVPVVLANIKDLLIVVEYCWDIIVKSSYGLQKPIFDFLERLEKNLPLIMSKNTLQLPDISSIWFTSSDAAKATGIAGRTAQMWLRELYQKGYLQRRDAKPRGYEYQIMKTPRIEEIKSRIQDPNFFTFNDFKEWAGRELPKITVTDSLFKLWKRD